MLQKSTNGLFFISLALCLSIILATSKTFIQITRYVTYYTCSCRVVASYSTAGNESYLIRTALVYVTNKPLHVCLLFTPTGFAYTQK